MITQSELKNLLDYSPENGLFRWIKPTNSSVRVNSVAGYKTGGGYIYITINGSQYMAHRLAWLYVRGVWPKEQIDHINHVGDDNRLVNLREATNQENQRNASIRKDNASGITGVVYRKLTGKWESRIKVNGKDIYLGCYVSKEKAIKRREFANVLYGFHENHGGKHV